MRYRRVCFIVPVDDRPENEGLAWARRALRSERLFQRLHDAAEGDQATSPPRHQP